jgi:hypothetical protein
MLSEVLANLASSDPVLDFLRRNKVEKIIGEEHIYPSMYEAVEVFQSRGVE